MLTLDIIAEHKQCGVVARDAAAGPDLVARFPEPLLMRAGWKLQKGTSWGLAELYAPVPA